VLIVPIFYLVIQATTYLGIIWPIIYLAMVLVSRYIINKTGFKTTLPAQSQTIMHRVHRIRIAVASGLLTAFGIGLAARLIIGPLSTYFWVPFVILTIVGALIGDSLWKTLQKRDSAEA
jgi:cation transport ATPase